MGNPDMQARLAGWVRRIRRSRRLSFGGTRSTAGRPVLRFEATTTDNGVIEYRLRSEAGSTVLIRLVRTENGKLQPVEPLPAAVAVGDIIDPIYALSAVASGRVVGEGPGQLRVALDVRHPDVHSSIRFLHDGLDIRLERLQPIAVTLDMTVRLPASGR